jgi:hypothetical protein
MEDTTLIVVIVVLVVICGFILYKIYMGTGTTLGAKLKAILAPTPVLPLPKKNIMQP